MSGQEREQMCCTRLVYRKLVGDSTAKCRLKEARVTETQFADDAALYSMSRSGFVASATGFVATARD